MQWMRRARAPHSGSPFTITKCQKVQFPFTKTGFVPKGLRALLKLSTDCKPKRFHKGLRRLVPAMLPNYTKLVRKLPRNRYTSFMNRILSVNYKFRMDWSTLMIFQAFKGNFQSRHGAKLSNMKWNISPSALCVYSETSIIKRNKHLKQFLIKRKHEKHCFTTQTLELGTENYK